MNIQPASRLRAGAYSYGNHAPAMKDDKVNYLPPWHHVFAKLAVLITVVMLSGCLSVEQPAAPPPVADSVTKKNVTVALLGATGMAGRFILDRALAEGYDVRALARTPQKLEGYKGRITIVEGDARDPAALNTLLEGSDVVVSALGPVRADGGGAQMISTAVTGQLLELMPQKGIDRYIVVSGAAVVMPGDDRNLTGWLMRQMVLLTLSDTLRDKQAEYHLLAASRVKWTLVRCPLIDPEPFVHSAQVSLETPRAFNVRAGELAEFVVGQINSQEFVGKGPFLQSR